MALLDLPLPTAAGLDAPAEELARRGDRVAWERLIARHQHRVVVALVAQGLAPHAARDFAQDAWARLIAQADAQQLPRLELPGLAIRQALFLARSAHRRDGEVHAGPDEVAAPPSPSAEALYVSREQLARTHAALSRMHLNARRVFECLYGDPPKSQAETAALLGLSLQRVRQILCEVRKELRATLEGDV